MSVFLASVVAKILQWLITIGWQALYDAVNDVVKKAKQDKIDKENKKAFEDAMKKKNFDLAAEAMRRLANGGKK